VRSGHLDVHLWNEGTLQLHASTVYWIINEELSSDIESFG
jgi:hypothetical protein